MCIPAKMTYLGRIFCCFLGLGYALSGQNLLAQAGAPDPLFQVHENSVREACLQPDGKILVTPGFSQASVTSPVMRLNVDGTIDSSFFLSNEDFANDAYDLTSANGYIYFLVYENGYPYVSYALHRYQSDGQPDTAFAAVTVPGQSVAGYLVQADGKILVWGDAIYRRNVDGSLDTTFQSPAVPDNTTINGLSMTSNGSIYVWGNFTTLGGVPLNGIARLNPDGTIDTNFVPATDLNTQVFRMVQEPSGTLLLNIYPPSTGISTLIRLKADGSQDTSFQSPSLQGTPFGAYLSGLTETSDQKILLWGTLGQVNQVAVPGYAKLNLDGTLDSSFTAVSTISGLIENILVQPDGKLLVAGKINRPDLTYTVPLVRLTADGFLDSSFDLVPENQITASRYLPPSIYNPSAVDGNAFLGQYIAGPVLVQPDGKILTGLSYYNPPFYGGGGVIFTIGTPPSPPPLFVRYEGDGNYPPHRPTTVTVDSISAQLTHVTWSSVADVTGYQIEREEAGQWVVKASVGPFVISYDDQTADGVTNYSYRIEAQNAFGFSIPSPAVAASIPTGFDFISSTADSPTQISLSWSSASGLWDYEIYRMDGASTEGVPLDMMSKIDTVSADTTSYVDQTVLPLHTYTYAIVARNVAGISYTSTTTITTPLDRPPVTPTRFLAGSAAANAIHLVWRSSPGADGYRIERSLNGSDGWQLIATLNSSAASYLDQTGLSSDQTYYYRITAYDAQGSSTVSTSVAAIAPDSTWNPPGTLDPSFAPNPPIINVYNDKISPTGAIYYKYGGNYINSTYLGTVDASGAGTGEGQINNTDSTHSTSLLAYLPLPDGKALVSSSSYDSFFHTSSYTFGRVDQTGNRDFSYTAPSITGFIYNIIALHSGNILITGTFTAVNGLPANGIARLNPDGTLDSSFSMTGIPLQGYAGPVAVEQSDGKLVVHSHGSTVVRLLTNGQQDLAFGNSGQVTLNASGYLNAQAIQPDDKIVLGGSFTTVDDGSGPIVSGSLVRLTADGKIDPTFDVGAGISPTITTVTSMETVTIYQQVSSLTIDPRGRILVQGLFSQYDTISCISLIRLLPNGQFDPSFILPLNFQTMNFVLSNDGKTFYAGTTLHRYFYGPTSSAPTLTFNQWRALNAITGTETETPQKDGVPNLLKYFFDINPTQSMSTEDRAAPPEVGIITPNGGPSYVTLTYRQNPRVTGITANIQTSSDLQTWQTVTNPNLTQTGTDPNTGDPIMQFQSAITGPKQFFRLNVISP